MSHPNTSARTQERHNSRRKPKRLKPAGHSATIEALIQPAIVIGSTLMSAIAAYVLALDEITRILDNQWQPSDVFVVALCAGMGFLIDMAIIVSATRYKMHAVRADPREDRWLSLAKWVLSIGLTSEAMTLFYFFVHLDAAAFPGALVWAASLIHAVLAVARAFLPPVVIAYFAAGVLPVMFDRADRNREIKSRTSSNIMLLIDRLSEVFDTDDKAEMLRALGGQLMLDTYATYDETARTSEDQQLRRDAKLLAHLARIHRLDWSAIIADVAPELVTPHTPELPAPQRPPEPSPEPPDDLPPDDSDTPSRNGYHHTEQAGGTTHLRFVPPVQTGSRRTAQNVKRDKTSGQRRGRSSRKGSPKRLTMAAYERLWASHVEDVRRRLDSGEKVTQYRVKTDYHVSGLTAARILARAQQRMAQPQAV